MNTLYKHNSWWCHQGRAWRQCVNNWRCVQLFERCCFLPDREVLMKDAIKLHYGMWGIQCIRSDLSPTAPSILTLNHWSTAFISQTVCFHCCCNYAGHTPPTPSEREHWQAKSNCFHSAAYLGSTFLPCTPEPVKRCPAFSIMESQISSSLQHATHNWRVTGVCACMNWGAPVITATRRKLFIHQYAVIW